MNILLTGGTGFIGKVLINKLLGDKNKITILTRDNKKVDDSLKDETQVLETDICNLSALEKSEPKLKDIDVFIHLAASLDYFGDRKELFRVNVDGTLNCLKLAERVNAKRFILISSIEAIGTVSNDNLSADESSTCYPVSSYGESKLEAETQAKKWAEKRKLNLTILRLGNVYGPGRPTFILPITLDILNKGSLLRFLPVYKDRYISLVHIDDAVDAIIKSLQINKSNQTYIITGEQPVTLGKLFELIALVLKVNIDLSAKGKSRKDELYLKLRKTIHRLCKRADLLTYFICGSGRRIHRAYSIQKARRELGYSPAVCLEKGISMTINWLKEEKLL